MSTIVLISLLACLSAYLLVLHARLNKEMKRARILQGFTAGIIRMVTDYHSRTDDGDLPCRAHQLPIPYEVMLNNIDWELSKDQLAANYERFLRNERTLFFDDKNYADDGFNFMYLDLFDKKLKEWQAKGQEK